MSQIAIDVSNVSKKYVLGQKADHLDDLRHRLERAVRAPWQWLRGTKKPATGDIFWALKEVSFGVKHGEVVGIIGRNGAGKSTLLKILSRITKPSAGRIRIRGRVASLLEVGTGFHPELTGRENIFLNGAILGMTRAEIQKKFDEIVDFSQIERFLDTPVKRYSSGMYVRLAFAVAAHIEPEILIVDEVLAVGDVAFQKKCLTKMGDVAHSGRTVLFVSHNMQAVTRLCSRCLLINGGQVQMDGPSDRVANAYLNAGVATTAVREWPELVKSPGDGVARLRAVRIRSEAGALVDSTDIRHPVGIELDYRVLEAGHVFLPHFALRNEEGTTVFTAVDLDTEWRGRRRAPGRYVTTGWIPGNLLGEGMFSVIAALMTFNPDTWHAVVEDVVAFRVMDSLENTDTARGDYGRPMPGVMRPILSWNTEFHPEPLSTADLNPSRL